MPTSTPRTRRRRKPVVELVELSLVPVRDTVLYPRVVAPLVVGRERSIRAIEQAVAADQPILVVTQRDPEKYEPALDDLYAVGTEAIIGRVLRMPDGSANVLVQGQRRMRLSELTQVEPHLRGAAWPVEESTEKPLPTEALMRAVLALFEKCVKLSHDLSEESYIAAMNADEPGWLADLIASSLTLTLVQRQELLEVFSPHERLERISIILAKELDVLELQSQINSKVQQEVDRSQREYFLREQMKAIQKELGDSDPLSREINGLREKITTTGMPEDVAKKAREELDRLSLVPGASPEVSVIRTYLDWLVTVPWTAQTEDNLDIKQAARTLDENHYGLPKVKERGVMPKPTKVIPDPKKTAERTACRKKVAVAEEE